jgi:hypothetical protein
VVHLIGDSIFMIKHHYTDISFINTYVTLYKNRSA